MDVDFFVEKLGLIPHPEGGYFREPYRSEGLIPKEVLADNFGGDRSYLTFAYYLLKGGQTSKFHKIASDELWHFYWGGPLQVVELVPDGEAKVTSLGRDLEKGQVLHHVVPSGTWFGAYVDSETPFALTGLSVAPGFDFADLKMADAKKLGKLFPQSQDLIEKLT